ncbi:MAG: cation transporter [Burkholderiales bacterium]|jgi:copper ion binding protein|nr:cation transporter [Burkholderiales bacterium]
MASQIFTVQGMTCNDCVVSIRKAVSEIDGVEKVNVSLEDGFAIVRFDDKKVDSGRIIAVIESVGFNAQIADRSTFV